MFRPILFRLVCQCAFTLYQFHSFNVTKITKLPFPSAHPKLNITILTSSTFIIMKSSLFLGTFPNICQKYTHNHSHTTLTRTHTQIYIYIYIHTIHVSYWFVLEWRPRINPALGFAQGFPRRWSILLSKEVPRWWIFLVAKSNAMKLYNMYIMYISPIN